LWLFLFYREIELGPEPGAHPRDENAAVLQRIEGTMGTIWFCLVAFMIAVYVLLDGFRSGAGAIHFWVAKTDEGGGKFWRASARCGRKRSVADRGGRNHVFCFPRALCQRVQRFFNLPLMNCFVASNSS